MTTFVRGLAAAVLAAGWSQTPVPAAHSCGWTPPVTDHVVVVRRAQELLDALARARPRTTIALRDGEYEVDRMADIAAAGTVVRSLSGNRDRVVIRGAGMTSGPVGVALSVSAPDVVIADLTVGYVTQHAIQVRGERSASRLVVHNVRLVDAGQQLLKGSVATDGLYADDGLVACSRFEYTTTAPSSYTGGVDLLAARGWTIRDNTFTNIRGPESEGYRAGPAILLWAASGAAAIERNLIVDSYRGIALGLGPGASTYARAGETGFDFQTGLIRNNVVCNRHAWADEAIEANAAIDVRIEHNTIWTEGAATGWSIGTRFPMTTAAVRNNLMNRPSLRRDGAGGVDEGNVSTAVAEWFRDLPACDLRLTPAAAGAIDRGVDLADVAPDFDGRPRAGRPDAGAFEAGSGAGVRPRS